MQSVIREIFADIESSNFVASLLRNGDSVVIANHWMQAEEPSKALKYYLEAIEDLFNKGPISQYL